MALLHTHIAPKEQVGLSPYEMLYGRPSVCVNDPFLDPEAQTLQSYTMAIGQFQQCIHLWGVNQDPKDSKEPPLYAPGTQVLIEVWKDGSPKAHWRALPCNAFYPHRSQGRGHNSWIHYSGVKPWKKTEEGTQYTCKPLGALRYLFRTTNECHSNEHPKIKLLVISFLRIALKSQDSSAEVVLQNKQEVDLLIPEQGGTWAILNEMCCFWANTSSQVKKRSHSPQEKYSDDIGSQRMSWWVLGVATISLWGILLLARGNLELANAATNPCYHHIDAAYY